MAFSIKTNLQYKPSDSGYTREYSFSGDKSAKVLLDKPVQLVEKQGRYVYIPDTENLYETHRLHKQYTPKPISKKVDIKDDIVYDTYTQQWRLSSDLLYKDYTM